MVDSKVRVPAVVKLVDPLANKLLGAGLPLGPNALITVRGRKSGVPRSTGVALVELNGRRWVQSPFGEVNWVRNLRESGEAILTIRTNEESVQAVELTTAEKSTFLAEVLAPYFSRIPRPFRGLMISLLGARGLLEDPEKAAQEHPVFELFAKRD
jgi:deazaflavin-dependent oxidoreductase (nitroreductase family)